MSTEQVPQLADPAPPAGSATAEPTATEPTATEPTARESAATVDLRRGRLLDLAAVLTFLALGTLVVFTMLRDPGGRHFLANRQDSVQLPWFLLHASRWFTHGESPVFTTLINAPYGVNLLANTSILAISLPLAPVTIAFGPHVSAALLLALAPAATAAAWYHVLSRHLVGSRAAAYVGALFAGFAPAMISQNTGHPNIAGQFVLPYIVLTVLRIRVPGRAVRTGLELAALVVLQVFINEEVLFLAALTLGLFVLATLAMRPAEVLPHVRRGLAVSGIAAAVAGAALAYPLWHQFAGPMAYRGLPEFVLGYGNDLMAFGAYATESVAGPSAGIRHLAPNATEQNTFYGPSLLVALAVLVVWHRRSLAVRALAVTGLIMAALSLGRTVTWNGHPTPVPGPWVLVADLPLFDSVVPTRLSLFVTPIIAVLLAISIDRVRDRRRAVRLVWLAALVAALAPIAPTPIATAPDRPTPRFFASGTWKEHLPVGATVVPVPMGWEQNIDVMQWQLTTNCDFVTPGGYYLAPAPTGRDRRANFGPVFPPTTVLLDQVSRSGQAPEPSPVLARTAREDLRRWRVDALVLPASARNAEALRATVDGLVGPGRQVDDVWLWDVRGLTR